MKQVLFFMLAMGEGDGLADPAVYQESTGLWRLMLSGSDYALAETTF